MSNIKEQLVGTWKLVHSLERDKKGNIHYPFGPDAIGYIMYDSEGHMAVQICRKQRSYFSSQRLKEATEKEAVSLTQDYLAYFGQYKIDEKNKLLTHLLEGNLCPNFVRHAFQRQIKFYDNKLSLRPYNDGTDREILWEK